MIRINLRILIVGLILGGLAACESPGTVNGRGSEHGAGGRVGFPIKF
jgi:hypothetical protein